MLDYVTLKIIWWALVGVLLIGFAIMDGHDMRGRHLAALCRPHGPGTTRCDQHRRAALGWQPSVVHHCRRRTVRGVAGGVCHRVQRGFTGR